MVSPNNGIHFKITKSLSVLNNLWPQANINPVGNNPAAFALGASLCKPPPPMTQVLIQITAMLLIPPNPLIQRLVGYHIKLTAPAITDYLFWTIIQRQQFSGQCFYILFEASRKMTITPPKFGATLRYLWFIDSVT